MRLLQRLLAGGAPSRRRRSPHRQAASCAAVALASCAGAAIVLLAAAPPAHAAEATLTGTVEHRTGPWDYWEFPTAARAGVSAVLRWNGRADLDLILLRRQPNGVYAVTAVAATAAKPESLVELDAPPGRWRLLVRATAGHARYRLKLLYADGRRPPPRSGRPAYLTLTFGRSMIGQVDDRCRLRPGATSLFAVAEALADRGIAATGDATLENLAGGGRRCESGARYSDWGDLGALRDLYGWSFYSRGRTSRDLREVDHAAQVDETCGSLRAFRAHGHLDAAAMYAYPSGWWTPRVQAGPVARCFAYGRTYQAMPNLFPISRPFVVRAKSVDGGRCNAPALACYSMDVRAGLRYTSPDVLVAYANAGLDGSGRWTMLQWYRLVTGRFGRPGEWPSWDCTSSRWRAHWTKAPETYCLRDFLSVVDRIDPSMIVTDPASLAALQGRGFAPALPPRPLAIAAGVLGAGAG
jgi:hypothetical protein